MSKCLWNFLSDIDNKFDGTTFWFNGQRFNISRINDELWNRIIDEYERAKSIVPTITFGIPFCIAYQNAFKTPDCKKIFGSKIKVAFPVPKNVEDYFQICTVLQLDKNAQLLTSKLQSANSAISELNDCLGTSKAYLLELLSEFEKLRRDLAEIKSKIHEASEQLTALTKLEEASREVSSLFGSDLVVLKPDFFSIKNAFECSLRIFSEKMPALENDLLEKDRMVSDQREVIASIEANLRAQARKIKETESEFRETKQKIFCELSKHELKNLPHQLHKYVDELRIHTNMKQAASVLAKHIKQVSDRSFVGSRIESAPKECSICCESKPNYFMLNCGHAAYCAECIAKLAKVCPVCRKQITSHKPLDLFDKTLFMQ